MDAEEINKSRVSRGLPPLPVLGELGYKGKGMCDTCQMQGESIPNTNKKRCTYYAASCKSVSRNCTGVKMLKANQ